MDGQVVHGGAFGGAFGEGPAVQRAGIGMEDVLDIGAGQGGGEGHVEGEIDNGINGRRGVHRRGAVRSSKGLRRDVGVRPRHAEGRGHSLPAMPGLAGEIGDLVHGQREASLEPLERVEGERRGERRRLGGGGRDRKIKTGQNISNKEEKFKTGEKEGETDGREGRGGLGGEERGREEEEENRGRERKRE